MTTHCKVILNFSRSNETKTQRLKGLVRVANNEGKITNKRFDVTSSVTSAALVASAEDISALRKLEDALNHFAFRWSLQQLRISDLSDEWRS